MAAEIKRDKIDSKEEEEAAAEEIWKYVFGFTPMAVVKCAIELGIPDILEKHETPMTLAELASELECSLSSLYRIMRFVLHDWGDEECIDILRKCREAIPQDTVKVIIVEAIVGREENHKFEDVVLMLDMVMMAHTSKGKERTLEEWSYVFNKAGFTRYTIKHIKMYHSVIEVYP
ncbi:hypothetical protein L2E82_11001 [Cichorium intybus]|uniref:Uncharacterized protein n=1 Tax=Cichorium intybus TaxID=13427 RepID=A0ACB9GCT8_CICIN|nr:hypothetical protein L2E82_11001 [Cichorium intybus]